MADSSDPRVSRAFLSKAGGSSWRSLETAEILGDSEQAKKALAERVAAASILMDRLQATLTTQNLVVLAGSGTSLGKEVGGPSMADLWSCSQQLRNSAAVLEKVCYPENEKSIEDLLSRCKAFLQVFGESAANAVADFVKEAETAIAQACTGFLESASLEAHKTFLRRMARRRSRAPRLRLFTTNYDLCFERAAGELGIVVIDGFTFSSPRHFDPRLFGYDIVRRAQEPGANNDFIEGVFQLLKLHGSVNWDRLSMDTIEQNQNPKNPCLIFPATSKYERSYTQPHLELISQFLAALREPNTALVLVGFGFGDSHLTAPILASLESNSSLMLLVVDPGVEERARELGTTFNGLASRIQRGDTRITLLNATFDQFSELIPDLQALSPAEQVAHGIRAISAKS